MTRIGSALSGLLLVLFLAVHLAGLLPALIAPVQFEQYAAALQPYIVDDSLYLLTVPALDIATLTAGYADFVGRWLEYLQAGADGALDKGVSAALQTDILARVYHDRFPDRSAGAAPKRARRE